MAVEIEAPADMVAVNREAFWTFVMNTQLNIHPYPHDREFTTWQVVGGNLVVGRTYPGWANSGDQEAYFLKKSYAPA
jgi:hypothetical protein